MKKYINNAIYALISASAFVACSSDDMPLTKSDEATYITFGTSITNVLTRAEHEHRAWNSAEDPSTMSVFGWADNSEIFTAAQRVSYESTNWVYTPKKYWADYVANNQTRFVACMPHYEDENVSTASYTEGDGSVVLTMKPNLGKGILTDADSKTFPLVAHRVIAPEMFSAVNFRMDQTLAGYKLQFQLGEKIGALRYFNITGVTISGTLPSKGTLTCTYPNEGEKTIAWSNLEKTVSSYDFPDQSLLVTSAQVAEWTGYFYGVPTLEFNPTISVTYDEYVKGTDDPNIETDTAVRKGVTSTIVFNKDYFPSLTPGENIGVIKPILIKIVPSYLYVLADDDQTLGYIVLE